MVEEIKEESDGDIEEEIDDGVEKEISCKVEDLKSEVSLLEN